MGHDLGMTVKRLPAVVPVSVLLEAQMTPDLRGRRVRVITGAGGWDERRFYVYGAGVEAKADGSLFVELLPESEHWRMVHTRQVDVAKVVRWPAQAVFLD